MFLLKKLIRLPNDGKKMRLISVVEKYTKDKQRSSKWKRRDQI